MRRRTSIAAALALIAALVVVLLWRGAGDTTPGRPAAGAPVATAHAPAPAPRERHDAIAHRRAALGAELPRLVLHGTVVDTRGAPVPGATVALALPARHVVTDEIGRFALDGLVAGRYVVEARAGAQVAGPITVELAAGAPEAVLRLYQGFVLEVEVFAADDGGPVEGAEVLVALISMHADAGRLRARTDRNGVARLAGLTYIGHEMLIIAAGFVDTRRGPGPDLIETSADTRRLRVGLRRARTEVRGRVVDEAGAAVADATVEVVRYQAGDTVVDEARARARFGVVDPHVAQRSGVGTRVGEDGRFRVGLDPGVWVLVAAADRHDAAVSEPIFAAADVPGGELVLTLGRGRRVSGVVVDAADVPVPGAAIEARWLDGTTVVARGHADGTGGFALNGLPAAPLELIATTATGRSRPTGVDLIAADRDEQLVVVELDGAITGAVVDARGAAIADAVVTYFDERPGRAPSLYPQVTQTGPEGRFAIRGLAPRLRYQLSAARPQHGRFVQHAAATTARAGDDVRITVPSGGAIVGRVEVTGDARRLIVRDLQTLTQVRPDADGRFRFDDLPALTYRLRITGPDVADVLVPDLAVHPDEVTDAGTIPIAPGRTLHGVVVASDGALLDEATVRVEVDQRYAVVTRTVHGRFTLRVPASAALTLRARHQDAGHSPAATMAPGRGRTAVRLTMLPAGRIRVVATAHGRGLADHVVTAWPAGEPRPAEPAAGAITDDLGGATLVVPAGAWHVELMLSADDGAPRIYQQTHEVAAHELVELRYDATDAPAGTIPTPRSELPELPVVGDEGGGDDDHH